MRYRRRESIRFSPARGHAAVRRHTLDLIAGDAVEHCGAFVRNALVPRNPRNPGHPEDGVLIIHELLSEFLELRAADASEDSNNARNPETLRR